MTEITSDEDLFMTQSIFKHIEENFDVIEQFLFGDVLFFCSVLLCDIIWKKF